MFDYSVFRLLSINLIIGLALISAVCYCLIAFGLMRIARKLGHPYPFFAWIPLLNTYQLGAIAGPEVKRNRKIGRHTIYDDLGSFLVTMKVIGILAQIVRLLSHGGPLVLLSSLAGLAAEIVLLCYSIIAVYHIYQRFVGYSAASFTVLYVFLPFVAMPLVSRRDPYPVDESK